MKRYPWLMLDLETLSLRPTAVILSIGYCAFDLDEVTEPRRIVLDINQQKNRHIDPVTVLWWMQQSDAARAVFRGVPVQVAAGLNTLNEYCDNNMVPKDERCVWGNGADFDNVLLANLYEWQGGFGRYAGRPWLYTGNRCFRTLKNLFRPEYEEVSKSVARVTHHDSASDAHWQAEVCRQVLRKIGYRIM